MRGDKLASNWKRIFAYIVDITLVTYVITRPLNKLLNTIIPTDIFSLAKFLESFDFKNFLIINLIVGVITIFYWAILEYKIQQTLGGILLGIKVKSEAKELNFLQALVRNVTKISTVILILDSIQILYSDKKQRYTERWSKTITIEDEK